MSPPKTGSLVHLLPLLVIFLLSTAARSSPLSLKLTSCNSTRQTLDFQQGWAQFGRNERALVGPEGTTGDWLLRINLVGTSSDAVSGYDNSTGKLATLFASTSILSSPIISTASSLCYSLSSSPPTTLPSSEPEACVIPAGPIALNLSLPLSKSYPLTTLYTQIRIVDTAYPNPNELGCVSVEMSPFYSAGWYYRCILWIPVGIAVGYWVVLWGGRAFASWCTASRSESERVGNGVGRKTAALGAGRRRWTRVLGTAVMSAVSGDVLLTSPSLLRFVTPGFRDIIYHIQYCSFLTQIAVLWPDFVYPISTQGAWASLLGNMTPTRPSSSLVNPLSNSTAYDPPSTFSTEFNTANSSLYLDPTAPNVFLNTFAHPPGMNKYALLVGLRPADLFPTSAAVFLILCGGVVAVSMVVWIIHGVGDSIGSKEMRRQRRTHVGGTLGSPPISPGMFGRPLRPLEEISEGDAGVRLGGKGKRDHTLASPARRQWWKFGVKGDVGAFYASSLQGNLIRLFLIFQGPLTAFTVYHFYLSSTSDPPSMASTVLAAIFFFFVLFLTPIFLIYRLSTVPSPKLYDATRTLLSLGPLYNVFGEGAQMYAAVLMVGSFVGGVVVGAGQKSGTSQAVMLLIEEIAIGLITSVWLPWGLGASMGATSFGLGVGRMITMVLVLILCQAISIGQAASAWIAYAVIVIQAIIFLFYFLSLVVKLVEALVRLVVRAPFDDSTDPYDTGILGAFSKASCCGDGLIRASGRKRKPRRQGFRVRGESHKRHSVTPSQQGMLESGIGMTMPAKSPGPSYYDIHDPNELGYFPKDPAIETGFIMGGWRPPSDYVVDYSPLQHQRQYSNPLPSDPLSAASPTPTRGFSVVRGGRAAYETPYTMKQASPPPSPGPNQALLYGPPAGPAYTTPLNAYPPSPSQQRPNPPFNHSRQKSESAMIENQLAPRSFNPGARSNGYSFAQAGYAVGPQPIAPMPIPREEDDGTESDETTRKPKRSSWFGRHRTHKDYSESSEEEEEEEDGRPGGSSPGDEQAPSSRWPFGGLKGKGKNQSDKHLPLGPNAGAGPSSSSAVVEPVEATKKSFSVVRPAKKPNSQSQSLIATSAATAAGDGGKEGKRVSVGYDDIVPIESAPLPKSSFVVSNRPGRLN